MKKAKKLTLQKKNIRDLTTTELGSIAGGLTAIIGPHACAVTQHIGGCGSAPSGTCGDTSWVICG